MVTNTIPISEKLEISVDRRLKTSHGSYATTLKGSCKSRDVIGEMMGHSASQVTEHIWRVWIWLKRGKSIRAFVNQFCILFFRPNLGKKHLYWSQTI